MALICTLGLGIVSCHGLRWWDLQVNNRSQNPVALGLLVFIPTYGNTELYFLYVPGILGYVLDVK